MSRESKDRHVWGETCPLYIPTGASALIRTGDMVQATDGIALATMADGDTSTFCGVAMQDKEASSTGTGAIRVATEGVFEFDTTGATADFAAGYPVKMSTGDDAQTVKKTTSYSTVVNAVGRIWKTSTNVSKVWVKINTRCLFTDGTST